MPDRSLLVLYPSLINCNRSALTMAVPLLRRFCHRMGDVRSCGENFHPLPRRGRRSLG